MKLKTTMMNRQLSERAIDKAEHLLFYFKGNIDAIFCHCMEVLDLLYEINRGKPFDEIKERVDNYQDILYYVTKVKKQENPKWVKCPYCGNFTNMHDRDCVFGSKKDINGK